MLKLIWMPLWSWYFELMVFIWLFYIFSCQLDVKIWQGNYHSPFNFFFSERSTTRLCGSEALLLHITWICYQICITSILIILLYAFLVTPVAPYEEYIIWRTSFSNFSNVLPVFTCARHIINLWNICLVVIIQSICLGLIFFYCKLFSFKAMENYLYV